MVKLKLVHLFSGVGAPEMALKRLSVPLEIVGYSEIDKYAIQSYKAIHGENIPYLGSITDIERLPKCNLLVYGSPCQDFSVAGKQKGLVDCDGNQTRSGLLLEVERLIEVANKNNELPEILLMENVKNLVGKKFKPDFDRWLDKLDELGYNNYWKVLNAKDYKVPQNRERVFVVSLRKDIGNIGYKFPEKMPLTKCIKDILEENPDPKLYLSDDKVEKFVSTLNRKLEQNIESCYVLNKGEKFEKTTDIACTLLARDYKGLGNYRGNAVVEYQIGASRGRNPENPSDRTVGSPTEQRLELNSQGISNTLTTVQKDNYVVESSIRLGGIFDEKNTKHQAGAIWDKNALSPTLDTCSGGNRMPKILEEPQIRIRKLSPRECWRLMDFSDEDFDKAKNSGISNTQLYKQAGNSIVVNVLDYIFINIFIRLGEK